MPSNPFTSDAAAQRYAVGRPYYHRAALDLAVGRLGISRVRMALDVGCGTGLSSRAVKEYADQVLALDASLAMLRAGEQLAGALRVAADAEHIPLRSGTADLVTVGAALHWFDPSRALHELARVVRAGAPVVVYSDYFAGRLAQRPAFTDWLQNSYLPRYPTPPRHAYIYPDVARVAGFTTPDYDEAEVLVPLTCAGLADYLLSQSNAAVAIDAGRVSADALRARIVAETAAYFPAAGATDAVFGIRVWTSVRER